MFKSSKRKIVASIMAVLTLLWLSTLAVIFFASYTQVSSTNLDMLEEYVAMYNLENTGGIMKPGKPSIGNGGPHFNTTQYKLSTFYSVAVSYEGKVLTVENDEAAIYSNDELTELALDVYYKDETRGNHQGLVYYKADKGGYILVGFMDNTIIKESMDIVFNYTVGIGGIAIIALFFLALYLANRIVKPLEESYQKQKQFISDAGHELKTPVSVVSANAELLSREIGNNQWLANIQYENERMGQLVSQLLELARTENITTPMAALDLSRLTSGGVLPFESVAYEKGLLLDTKITEGIIVNGNANQLSQLVSILIDNAIQHGCNGKQVSVVLSKTRGEAVFSVINDGEAIPADRINELFERFYRMDESRTGEGKHYGLGLAIAKAIVTTHRGRIDVNCADGKVCFTARIPRI